MGFFDDINSSIDLVKDTFRMFKDKPVLMEAPKQLFFLNLAVAVILFVLFLVSIPLPFLVFIPILLLIAALLVMPFIATYYYAALSWMVFQSFQDKPVTLADGMDRAKANLADIVGLTIVTMIVNWFASQLRKGQGILGIILHFVAAGIEEGWDIIGNFLLPASIVSDKNLLEAAKDAQLLLKNIPAALTGGLAFDAIRYLIMFVIMFGFFIAIFGSIFLGTLLGPLVLVLLFPIAILFFVAYALVSIAVSATKVTFFTLLYMQLSSTVKVKKTPALDAYLENAKKKAAKK